MIKEKKIVCRIFKMYSYFCFFFVWGGVVVLFLFFLHVMALSAQNQWKTTMHFGSVIEASGEAPPMVQNSIIHTSVSHKA